MIILDSNEYSLYKLKNQIELLNPDVELFPVLANVTNKKRVKEVCEAFKVNTIYHCAAYKHVSLG